VNRKSQINVHFTVSKNSLSYLKYALATYENLSSRKVEIQYYIYCLDKSSFRRLRKRHSRVIFVDSASGSSGHAKAIDRAFQLFAADSINIVSDTDIAIVFQNWDLELVRVFDNSDISILGTQLEGIGGFSSGSSKYQQYKNKPSTTWLAFGFNTDISGLSASPNKESTILITNQDLSRIYGLPIGFELVRDTGWQIPNFIEKNHLGFKLLEIIKPTSSESRVLRGLNPYHDEFHLEGAPFLVHQRGSMTHLFRRDALSKDFYEAIDSYLGTPKWSPSRSSVDFIDSLPILLKRATKKCLRVVSKYTTLKYFKNLTNSK
jgi:hypothetical protein